MARQGKSTGKINLLPSKSGVSSKRFPDVQLSIEDKRHCTGRSRNRPVSRISKVRDTRIIGRKTLPIGEAREQERRNAPILLVTEDSVGEKHFFRISEAD
jgi:hypothetical protein